MTTTCRDFDALLSLHATGALDAADETRVADHLAGCPACRAEADDLAAALDLAKLPPPSEAERRVLDALPDRTLAAWHRGARVRSLGRRVGVGLAAAAAAAALVLFAPAALHRRAAPPAGSGAGDVAGAAAGWEQPDLDDLWSDSALVDVDVDASADAAQPQDDWDPEAAVAALDL